MKLPRREIRRARIEIIPMIDTIFFLLVYFMISSLTMVQMSACRVNLAGSRTANGKPAEKVVVSLSKEGRYYINRDPVAFAEIEPRLRRMIAENPSVTVVVNVDKSRNIKQFLEVMNAGEKAQPADLVIATQHEAGE